MHHSAPTFCYPCIQLKNAIPLIGIDTRSESYISSTEDSNFLILRTVNLLDSGFVTENYSTDL